MVVKYDRDERRYYLKGCFKLLSRVYPEEIKNSDQYGNGPVIRVVCEKGRKILAGKEKLRSVMDWCINIERQPMFYIDKDQSLSQQYLCVLKIVDLAAKLGTLSPGIMSPSSMIVNFAHIQGADGSGIETVFLAGGAKKKGENPFYLIESEALLKTTGIAFYAFEYDTRIIERLITAAKEAGIVPIFNVRDEAYHRRDVGMEKINRILEMDGVVFGNDLVSILKSRGGA